MSNAVELPDITQTTQALSSATLQWVGMEGISLPAQILLENKYASPIIASADIYVSLDDPNAKGIHMSRLYFALNDLAHKPLNGETINTLLQSIIESQNGISNSAKIAFKFELAIEKKALLSGHTGYQTYSCTIEAELHTTKTSAHLPEQNSFTLKLDIPYSSTCPCSASLSQQLYAQAVSETFPSGTIDKRALLHWMQSQAGSIATPHSQRSFASVTLKTDQAHWPALDTLIFQLEDCIGTPVQTAVKRSDEQAFAKLNANNLMFCEDAARKLKTKLLTLDWVTGFAIKVDHQESLHAHNAVAMHNSL